MKELVDDNSKFDKKWKKFLQKGRKHCGKRRNCLLRTSSPFPAVFSKDMYRRYLKPCHVWEYESGLYIRYTST